MSEKDQSSPVNKRDKGKIAWQCPSNIALVKYWGKKGNQLPLNPSISMTLKNAFTEMEMHYGLQDRPGTVSVEYYFNEQRNPGFESRVRKYLEGIAPVMPALKQYHLTFYSRNTFPHSTGIASSASSMGALALCLASFERELSGKLKEEAAFMAHVSALARLASGSASRSVYGGYVIWGQCTSVPGSSDEKAIPLPFEPGPVFQTMRDSILVVSKREKEVSSSAGHALMRSHVYGEARLKNAAENMDALVEALRHGDLEKFINITEWEALNLHALMMTSANAYLLIEPNTLRIVKAVRDRRKKDGIPVCFTLDAGPNIHLLYPASEEAMIRNWIDTDLSAFCEDGTVIHDRCGPGPLKKE